MIGDRALIAGAIATCASAYLAAQQAVGPKDLQRLCGQVVSITCFDAQPPTIALAVRPTIIVLVRPESDEGHRPWPYASQLLYREACAVGQLTRKGTAVNAAMFTIASISAIKPTREDRTDDWAGPGVARSCDAGIQPPKLTKMSHPHYPREAAAKALEGEVWVEGIVETDGKIRRARVIRSIDIQYGLDVEAMSTIKRWRFDAGTRDGKPTPFLVTTQISFTLKDRDRRP